MIRDPRTNQRLCEVTSIAVISLVQRLHVVVAYRARESDGRRRRRSALESVKVLVLKVKQWVSQKQCH